MKNVRRRLSIPMVLALLASATPLPAADGGNGLRVTVDVALIDVVVVDGDGEPVMDLTKDDFEVYEDGKKQTITDFDVVRRGARASTAEPATAGPGATAPVTAGEKGGTFMFFFDQQDGAPYELEKAKEAAARMIQTQLGTKDQGAALRYDGYLRLVHEMTSDKGDLASAVSQKTGDGAWSRDAARSGNLSRWDALGVVAQILAPIPGRKTLVLFSRSYGAYGEQGTVTEAEDDDETVGLDELKGWDRMVATMNAANVAIFPVDATGRPVAPGDASSEIDQRATRASTEPKEPGARRRSTMGERRAPRGRTALGAGQLGLDRFSNSKAIAEQTGGEAVIYGEHLDEKLARVARLAGNYYMIGYAPPAGKKGFRDVKVEVKRKGLRVMSRRGYVSGLVPRPPAASAVK